MLALLARMIAGNANTSMVSVGVWMLYAIMNQNKEKRYDGGYKRLRR